MSRPLPLAAVLPGHEDKIMIMLWWYTSLEAQKFIKKRF